MVPEDDFEDNPPMGWEQPQYLDILMNETHEFCQGYQTQRAYDGHEEAPQPRFPLLRTFPMRMKSFKNHFQGQQELPSTQDCTAPSFGNVALLLKKIDELPSSTAWKCHTVTLHGDIPDYNGVTQDEEVKIWCHDPVEVI
ncbi:hypothetical protein M422DRAFT_264335 [Sphaerobolus stellatus SS14]|uniref:Uncharacterized protein n=1 Tax=Sphaerobolus stellatus (strain SS14) TaxID=990650 RepID=A0A0C9UWR0_SPHS4|nr:hypothetical protein M422DRAFT_264335 [Sphaerobolus stellatus SS14]